MIVICSMKLIFQIYIAIQINEHEKEMNYLNTDCRIAMYENLILPNFCGKRNSVKLKTWQQRAVCFVSFDYTGHIAIC